MPQVWLNKKDKHIRLTSKKIANNKELINKVSWNDRPAKFDLRDWNHEGGKMGKGVTLTEEDARMLMEALEEVL